MARDEIHQIAAAQARLALGKRVRLSEFGALETTVEFDLFLDLLGEALALKIAPGEIVVAQSTDGSLRIRLEPVEPAAEAVIATPHGLLRGQDHYVTISNAFDEPPDSVVPELAMDAAT
jgi:hypothetical protein